MSTGHRCDTEERDLHDTKVSDSGYSNSCSNSQSQRSSGSSESRHSSSSGSSGYCGHQTAPPSAQTQTNIIDSEQQSQLGTTGKRKDKKKKSKVSQQQQTQQESAAAGQEAAAAAAAASTASPPSPQPQGPGGAGDSPNAPPEHANNVGDRVSCGGCSPGGHSEAIQMAAIAQTFTCIKKYASKDTILPEDAEPIPPQKMCVESGSKEQQIINSLKVEPLHEEELYVVVSLKDGIVVYTTPNISQLLGYPKDMWIGRSLIDFVHPKHRVAFASHITSIIANPLPADQSHGVGNAGGAGSGAVGGAAGLNWKRSATSGPDGNSFFCCLRQYRGLVSSGFTVTDKKVCYLPCQLTTTFKQLHNLNRPTGEGSAPLAAASNNCVFLVITATAVRSAYKYGDEVKAPVKFMTRHLANCQVSHVDSEVMPYFGYLPQDMINSSIFDYYHPEDLRTIKEGYQAVMKEQGHPVKSKPHRFRCQNGGFALVETEWSAFINPWSRKLEFVISQHTVLKGPQNPDVTTPVNELEPFQVSDEVMKESKTLQEEIKSLLNETVIQPMETVKQQVSKRCKDLATFMEALMDSKPHDLKVDVLTEDHSFSERDSVMLGEISPHHEYYNSKSSSETPPSYNQLNYNENLQRFFESQPKTTLSDESGDSKLADGGVMMVTVTPAVSSGGEEGKTSPIVNSSEDANSRQRACCFGDNMGESGTSSGQSIESNSGGGHAAQGAQPDLPAAITPHPAQSHLAQSPNESSNGASYKPLTLTEQLLSKHNEDMEKQMMQKHRELRNKGDSKNKERHKTPYDKMQDDGGGAHGIKRSVSHSWEGEPYKSMKQAHTEAGATAGGVTGAMGVGVGTGVGGALSSVYPTPLSSHQTLPPMSSVTSGAPLPSQPHHRHRAALHQHKQQQPANVNLWPPFSVGITPLQTTPPNFTTPTLASPIVPMYYVPEPPRVPPEARTFPQPSPATYITQQVPYVPSMLYHPLAMFTGTPSPVVYSPLTMVPAAATAPPPQPSRPQQQPRHHNNHTHHNNFRQSHHHFVTPKTEHDPPATDQSGSGRGGGGGGRRGASAARRATSLSGTPATATTAAYLARQVLAGERLKTAQVMNTSQLAPNPNAMVVGCSFVDKKQADLDGDSNETSNAYDDSSNYSSFYSFLKTDKSDDSMKSSPENDIKSQEMVWEKSDQQGTSQPIKKVAPWLEDINVTSDLLLKYQLRERHLKDVLEEDYKALERITQPSLVNDQLSQMYLDLELEGLSRQLTLEEGITSSSDSSGEDNSITNQEYKKKRYMEYDKMVIIFEENAPLPPPPPAQPAPVPPMPCN